MGRRLCGKTTLETLKSRDSKADTRGDRDGIQERYGIVKKKVPM